VKGATSVAVSSVAGFKAADLVLVDMLDRSAKRPAHLDPTAPPGGNCARAYPYSEYNPTRRPKATSPGLVQPIEQAGRPQVMELVDRRHQQDLT